MQISIIALTPALFDVYCEVGSRSYREYYLHLWENEDPTPYITTSFTYPVLIREMANLNNEHFIAYHGASPVGVFKVILHSEVGTYTSKDAFLLEKLYILREYSGMGIGTQVLRFVENKAKALHKKVIWLDTMKKGPAQKFYVKNGFEILKEKTFEFPNILENARQMFVLYKTI